MKTANKKIIVVFAVSLLLLSSYIGLINLPRAFANGYVDPDYIFSSIPDEYTGDILCIQADSQYCYVASQNDTTGATVIEKLSADGLTLIDSWIADSGDTIDVFVLVGSNIFANLKDFNNYELVGIVKINTASMTTTATYPFADIANVGNFYTNGSNLFIYYYNSTSESYLFGRFSTTDLSELAVSEYPDLVFCSGNYVYSVLEADAENDIVTFSASTLSIISNVTTTSSDSGSMVVIGSYFYQGSYEDISKYNLVTGTFVDSFSESEVGLSGDDIALATDGTNLYAGLKPDAANALIIQIDPDTMTDIRVLGIDESTSGTENLVAVASIVYSIAENGSQGYVYQFGEQPTPPLSQTTASSNGTMFKYDLAHIGVSPSSALTSADKLWSTDTGANEITSSPAIANNTVYIGLTGSIYPYNSMIYALASTNGVKVWNFTTGGYVTGSPAVVNDTVYFGASDGLVYALNAINGAQLWNYTTGSVIMDSSPAVVNGTVFIGSYDWKVYALNATDGALIWSYATGSYVDSSPAVVDGVVYIGSDDYKVYALNETDGTKIWEFAGASDTFESSPCVANGIVYIGSDDSKLYALNATDGTEVWHYTAISIFAQSSPSVANDVVYVGATNIVYALNATDGTQIWNKTVGCSRSPSIAGNVAYLGSTDGKVYALSTTNGAELWNYTVGGLITSTPTLVNSVLYVGAGNGSVYALTASAPSPTSPPGGGGGFGNNPTSPPNGGNGGSGGWWDNLVQDIMDALKKIPWWAIWILVAILLIAGFAGVFKKKKRGGTPSRSFNPNLGGM